MVPEDFKRELTNLINKHGVEQCGDTPDYILSQYLCDCIDTLHKLTKTRDKWYGVEHRLPDDHIDAGIARLATSQ